MVLVDTLKDPISFHLRTAKAGEWLGWGIATASVEVAARSGVAGHSFGEPVGTATVGNTAHERVDLGRRR